MGTSSMYGGPGGGPPKKDPLLPKDFDPQTPDPPQPDSDPESQDDQDSEEEQQEDIQREASPDYPVPEVNWQSAKTAMSKFVSGSAGNLAGAVSGYVKAHGGGRSASRSMPSGIRTTTGLSRFVNRVATSGFRETLTGYHIEYEGKSATEILTQLIAVLAPSPVTREDAIARKALVVTMEQLYDFLEEQDMDIMEMDAAGLNFIVPCYIKSFIYERLLNDLGSRVESADISPDQALKIEAELKEYIDAKVEIVLKGKDFSANEFNTQEVESLYNQCYTAMEIMI